MEFVIKDFDKSTKCLFADSSKTQWVQIGGPADRDSTLGIRNGRLKLNG